MSLFYILKLGSVWANANSSCIVKVTITPKMNTAIMANITCFIIFWDYFHNMKYSKSYHSIIKLDNQIYYSRNYFVASSCLISPQNSEDLPYKKVVLNRFSASILVTLVLKNGEFLEKSVKIKTIHGNGTLYVTNTSIILVIEKKGILFEQLHTQITSIKSANKNRIKITWYENSDMFDFTFKIDNAQNIINDILTHHNYDDIFSDIQTKS